METATWSVRVCLPCSALLLACLLRCRLRLYEDPDPDSAFRCERAGSKSYLLSMRIFPPTVWTFEQMIRDVPNVLNRLEPTNPPPFFTWAFLHWVKSCDCRYATFNVVERPFDECHSHQHCRCRCLPNFKRATWRFASTVSVQRVIYVAYRKGQCHFHGRTNITATWEPTETTKVEIASILHQTYTTTTPFLTIVSFH